MAYFPLSSPPVHRDQTPMHHIHSYEELQETERVLGLPLINKLGPLQTLDGNSLSLDVLTALGSPGSKITLTEDSLLAMTKSYKAKMAIVEGG